MKFKRSIKGSTLAHWQGDLEVYDNIIHITVQHNHKDGIWNKWSTVIKISPFCDMSDLDNPWAQCRQQVTFQNGLEWKVCGGNDWKALWKTWDGMIMEMKLWK